MLKKILSAAVALGLAAQVFAQTEIKVQAPSLVSDSEQFNVTFLVEGENAPSDIEWEPSDAFTLVWGPQKGSSTSISIINGKRTKSSQTTFTYVLMPRRAGTFQLPAASARVKGKTIVSGSHSIEVVSSKNSSGQSSSASPGQSRNRDIASSGAIDDSDLFLRLTLSRSKVVVGEPITATLKLYSRVSVAGFEDVKFPSFNGFWSQELQAPKNIEFNREKVGDEIYDAALLRSYTLIPQQSGAIIIDPAEMVCQVMVRAPRTSTGSIFDSFFQDDYRTVRKRISTPALTLKVSPLPAGAPGSFGGGVGQFRISASLSRDSLKTHDAASLKITVSGKGNVSMLDAPKVSFPPDFDVYDVKVTENSDKTQGRLSGSKTFEYPFIPRSYGSFVIPPVEYSYYDSSAGKYVTLTTQEIPLNVARGNESELSSAQTQASAPGVLRKDVRDLGSDIRFIVTKAPKLVSGGGRFFVLSPLFWGLAAALLLLAVLVYLLARRASALRSDVVASRGRAATKMARRRLSKAASYLSENLYSAFYEELHKALLGFVSDKLGMNAFDLSKENISERLIASSVSEGLAGDFLSLLEACEFARYSSSGDRSEMNSHYEKSVSVISALDSAMKRKPGKSAGAALALTLILAGAAPCAEAASAYPDSLWNAGVTAYTGGNWNEALQAWSSLESLGVAAPELYYNLGNAFFKAEQYGRAILNYERALKLDPSFKDASFNLAYANEFIQDRIETVPEFFLKTWIRRLRAGLSSDAWATISLVLFALALAMLLLFLLSKTGGVRRSGFYSSIVAFLLFVLSFACALSQKNDATRADSAIVMVPVCSVKSSPGADSSKDLFVLHEGTKVVKTDEVGEWISIEIADGRRGWLPAKALETI